MDGTAPPLAEGRVIGGCWRRDGNRVELSVYVTGTPKPKARPRTVRNPHTGFVQTYTPATTVNWEQTIVLQVKQTLAEIAAVDAAELDVLPLSGRILAEVQFYCKRPKSAPKSVLYPLKAQPGDIDNLAKSVLDALQLAGVIEDDKTVTDLFTSKRFSDETHAEGVDFTITAWLN